MIAKFNNVLSRRLALNRCGTSAKRKHGVSVRGLVAGHQSLQSQVLVDKLMWQQDRHSISEFQRCKDAAGRDVRWCGKRPRPTHALSGTVNPLQADSASLARSGEPRRFMAAQYVASL